MSPSTANPAVSGVGSQNATIVGATVR
jgi:hypothetical protein